MQFRLFWYGMAQRKEHSRSGNAYAPGNKAEESDVDIGLSA
jgi:hypothetical protein